MRSGIALPVPLYGMCVIWMLVMEVNISPARWDAEPGPDDAKLSSRGLALASAMTSFTFLAASELVTHTAYGWVEVTVTALRSRTGSYGRCDISVALMACDGLTTAIV